MWAASMLQVMSMANLQSPITQCADNSPLPLYYTNECPNFLCCKVSGDPIDITLKFKTTRPVSSLQFRIKAVLTTDLFTVQDFPPPEPDACRSLQDASCPLKAGEKVTYESSYITPTFKQEVYALVEYRMVDRYNKTQVCFGQVFQVLPPGGKCDKKCH